MKPFSRIFTLNAVALPACTEFASLNAVTLPDAPADGWYLISPTGTFPEPDGTYVQVFGVEQAQSVVSTFNSFTGRAARHIKNLWHGYGVSSSIPIFEGHSDRDPKRWPTMNRLGEITDLRADEAGLWGLVTWNAANLANRTHEFGPLKPSPVYWHEPKDEDGNVYPAMLESIGLVRFPNIKSAPAWTQNAIPSSAFADNPADTKNHMNHREKLIALLGLKSDADDAAIQSSLDAHSLKVTNTANALTAAETAKSELETQLSTANSQVQTLTTEKETLATDKATLTTANAALTTEVETLRKGVLDLAEKKGAITPGERKGFEDRIAAESTRNAALAELPGRKAMNVTSVTINNERIDLSTANARRDALNKAVADRMQADKCDYDTAFGRVQADPNFAALFAAMQDPTQKAA